MIDHELVDEGLEKRRARLERQPHHDSAPEKGSRISRVAPPSALTATGIITPAENRPNVSTATAPSRTTPASDTGGRIRIMLVDDHVVMRQGLARLLKEEDDMEIVGEASDGESAVNMIREIQPEVVLMDISMPRMTGIQATQIIHQELPHIRIIGLSMFDEAGGAAAMREAGAVDYLTKSGPSEAVIAAIRSSVRPPGRKRTTRRPARKRPVRRSK